MDPDFSGRPSFRSVGPAIVRVYTVIDRNSLARHTGEGGWRRMVNMHAVNGAGVQCSRSIQCWPCCCWMWMASRACRAVTTAAVIRTVVEHHVES